MSVIPSVKDRVSRRKPTTEHAGLLSRCGVKREQIRPKADGTACMCSVARFFVNSGE